ncbi:hypothetical protein D3C75_998930 [compost metagenome]
MAWKKFLSTIRLKALIAVGNIKDQSVSVRCRDLTTKYVGIIPPLNSIVKSTPSRIGWRPRKYFLDSG